MANLKANSTIGGYNVLTYGDIYRGKDSIDPEMLANANDLRETWEKAVSAYSLAGTKLNATDNAVSASKLLTARTISVTGGATGSFTFDGSANVSVSLSVNNTTHNHDSTYLKLAGGTMTGTLTMNGDGRIDFFPTNGISVIDFKNTGTNNDRGWIKHKNNSTSAASMEFCVSDDPSGSPDDYFTFGAATGNSNNSSDGTYVEWLKINRHNLYYRNNAIYHVGNKPTLLDVRGYTQIGSGFDFNTIQDSGMYASSSAGVTDDWLNTPDGQSAGYTWQIIRQLGNRCQQIVWSSRSTNKMFTRMQLNNEGSLSWTSWKTIYDSMNKPTATDIGLGNVNNTADSTKSVLSATKLTTPRQINGVSFDGSADITIRQASYMGITNSSATTGHGLSLYGGAVNGAPSYGIMFSGTGTFGTHGSVTSDWATYFTMAGSTSRGWIFKTGNTAGGNVASISATGVVTATTFSGALTGNATTATTLQTTRTINGTNFNGSGNITTSNWGTARTLTIGNSSKSINGSANVAWTLSEIGAAPTSHTHTISQITGGTLGTLTLTANNTSGTYNTRAIELREVNNVTTSQSSDAYAPAIGFHWGGRFGKKLFMNASGVLTYDGEFSSTRTKNPAYNDYAEYFPKEDGYRTEAGDIIALRCGDGDEIYELAKDDGYCNSGLVVGVHSDEYGHLMGGEYKPDDFDGTQEEWNEKKYIPVGLVGRVYVKFKGTATKGTMVVPSEIAGVGRAFNPLYDKDTRNVVGYIVENKDMDGIYKVRIKLGK